MAQTKERLRKKILSSKRPGFDSELTDRTERYEAILEVLKQTSDYDKTQRELPQMSAYIAKANSFCQAKIPYLKTLNLNMKSLVEKNDRYLTS